MTAKIKAEKEREIAEACSFFGTFIEMRYTDSKYRIRVLPGDEKTAYDMHCLCGIIDSDGMVCFLGQPKSSQESMLRSARKLGLNKLVELIRKASAALRRSGLSLNRKGDREAIGELLEPYERTYYRELQPAAYERLYQFIGSQEVFVPYILNCARMDKDGGNPFDAKEWTPTKLKAAVTVHLSTQSKNSSAGPARSLKNAR